MVYVIRILILIQWEKLMDVDVLVNELKSKIITEFNCLLSKIKKGYNPSLEFILEEISTLEIYKDIDNRLALTMLQYYINHQ